MALPRSGGVQNQVWESSVGSIRSFWVDHHRDGPDNDPGNLLEVMRTKKRAWHSNRPTGPTHWQGHDRAPLLDATPQPLASGSFSSRGRPVEADPARPTTVVC